MPTIKEFEKMKVDEAMKKCRRAFFSVQARKKEEGEEEDEEYVSLEGKAVVFNEQTELQRFTNYDDGTTIINEIIDARAFDNTDMSDVIFDLNHDAFNAIPLARTRNKSLAIDVREDGVYFTAKIKRTNEEGMKVYNAVKEGLLDRCSFMFTTPDDGTTIEQTRKGNDVTYLRKVTAIDRLFDLSVVNTPAYDSTSIDARTAKDLERFAASVETDELQRKREAVMKALDKTRL